MARKTLESQVHYRLTAQTAYGHLEKWTFECFCGTIHSRKVRYAVGVGKAYMA